MTQPLVRSELVTSITALHHVTSAPFELFVTETLRMMEFPVSEDPPAADVAAEVRAVTEQYFTAVTESEPFFDVLGPVYSEVSSGGRRQQSGQFFTPWGLALLSAEMVLGDWKPTPNPNSDDGLWRLYEPACGAGAMLLAAMSHIATKHGPDALLLWDVAATDVDRTVARTCALQVMATLARHGWGVGRIRIEHGNTLSVETFGVVMSGEAKRRHPMLTGELAAAAAVVALASHLVDSAMPPARPDPPHADDRGQYTLLPPPPDSEAA